MKLKIIIGIFLLLGANVGAVRGVAAQTTTQKSGQAQVPPQQDHSQHQHEAPKKPSAAEKYFTDVVLLNQDGKPMRFYNDVLKGKVVVINAFFTSCTNVCPPMNRNFEKIQAALGERLGRDAFLVSISVDPGTDTPSKLKEYAARFHAKPGWLFLTGKKENVEWALYKLGQYVETKDDHKTIVLIGNEPKGVWKKAFGLANADELIKLVEEVLKEK